MVLPKFQVEHLGLGDAEVFRQAPLAQVVVCSYEPFPKGEMGIMEDGSYCDAEVIMAGQATIQRAARYQVERTGRSAALGSNDQNLWMVLGGVT
jgi:hypothetical protein